MTDQAASRPARCPICAKPATEPFRPFCSRRCADVDLNRWLSGVYAVPGKEERTACAAIARAKKKGAAERVEHDPEKWTPVFGKDHAQTEHDPEKWTPVFG